MLVLREEQIAIMARAVRARFADEAYEHLLRYFPDRCAALGKEAAIDEIRQGLKRARGYGFQSEYDLLRYLNLLFEFGEGFEQSQANAWALPYLDPTGRPPTVRMDLLMAEAFERRYPIEVPNRLPAEAEEEGAEFDGMVWDDLGIDPSYVPQSIQPEYEPIPPRFGSPPEATPGGRGDEDDDDDDDDGEVAFELEAEAEEIHG
jgi:hypothetical protein